MNRVILTSLLIGLGGLTLLAQENKGDQPGPEEKRLLELTNAERKKENLQPLTLNPQLTKAARGHSRNMAFLGKIDHIIDGKNPGNRADDAGYDYSIIAENIWWGEGASIEDGVKWWMKSPTHRPNILNKEFTDIGLGVVKTAKGHLYLTQLFAAPRKK